MFYAFLGALIGQLPLLLAYIVGVVLALTNRQKYSRAAHFLLAAIALSFVVQLSSTAFILLAPYLMQEVSGSHTSFSYYNYAFGIISNLGHTAAFGLLLAAVFAGRTPQKSNQQLEGL